MVDCGNLRCFQERRSIRKELLSWSKKVPVVVGLETIAEHVGSRRKVRKLFEPFRCLESKQPVDWEPEENCIYCPDKVQELIDAIKETEKERKEEDLDAKPSSDTVPSDQQPDKPDRDVLKDIQTEKNEADSNMAVDESSQSAAVSKSSPVIFNVNGGTDQKDRSKTDSPTIKNLKRGHTDDDVTAVINDVANGKLGPHHAAALYGIPRSTLRSKMPRLDMDDSGSGRDFMDDEDSSDESTAPPNRELPFMNNQEQMLQLSDLLQLQTMQYLAPLSLPYLVKPDILATFDNLELEKKLQQVRHKHNLNKASNNHYKERARKYPLRPFQKELIKKLTKERIELERRTTDSLKSDNFIDMKTLTHSVILSALEGNSSTPSLQQHVRPHQPALDLYSNALNHSALLSALNMKPLISPHISGLGLENPTPAHPNITVPAYSPAKSSASSSTASTSLPQSSPVSRNTSPNKQDTTTTTSSLTSDISQSPSQVLFKYENTRIGDTLKDIIVKTISEKVKCKLESTDFSGLVGGSSSLGSQKAKETIMSAFSIPQPSTTPTKRIKREPLDSPSPIKGSGAIGNTQNGTPGSPVKKTRPKRGQYRKYNSQLLTEAVKAVQRGEMSVHRAGSYYGVPHSTLEYKVKERHLLRQKKIKEQQERKLKEAEEAKKNEEKLVIKPKVPKNEKLSSDSSKLAADLLNISSPKSFAGPSWLPPFVGPSPFESATALGLFGSGFALSTPASELLRKLQHKVQSKSESGDDSSLDSTSFTPASED